VQVPLVILSAPDRHPLPSIDFQMALKNGGASYSWDNRPHYTITVEPQT
jgi:hypothetical protein